MKMHLFAILFFIINIVFHNAYASLRCPSTRNLLTRSQTTPLHLAYARKMSLWEKFFGPSKPPLLQQPPRPDFDKLIVDKEYIPSQRIITDSELEKEIKLFIETYKKPVALQPKKEDCPTGHVKNSKPRTNH